MCENVNWLSVSLRVTTEYANRCVYTNIVYPYDIDKILSLFSWPREIKSHHSGATWASFKKTDKEKCPLEWKSTDHRWFPSQRASIAESLYNTAWL